SCYPSPDSSRAVREDQSQTTICRGYLSEADTHLVPFRLKPMPLLKRAAPFDDPDWIFELKYDGFRALAIVEHGRAQLLSRNGHPFASFSALAESISDSLPNVRAVDRRGKPAFFFPVLRPRSLGWQFVSQTPRTCPPRYQRTRPSY